MRSFKTAIFFPKSRNMLRDLGYICIGACLQAIAYALFIAPANIVPGGVYGISITINHISKGIFNFAPDGFPLGVTALFFNVPLLLLAIRKLGLLSGPKTVLTFILISVFTDLFTYLYGKELVPGDKFLAAFYGGGILALGVYLVFKAGSTSAGTDVLGRVIAKGTNLKLSNVIIVIDSVVVLLGLLAFKDWSVPLYSWLTIVVYGKVIDLLQPENPSKAVFIVSPKTKEIRQYVLNSLHLRGTFLHGRGMYNGQEKEIIFMIVERKSIHKLKRGVRDIDPQAFVSTMDASNDLPVL